ncbi:MAG: hypothetical protein ACREVP_02450 [Burkholderiales bacterium]
MVPYPTRCCLYKIQEGTNNEYVAIGWDGNIVRWGPLDGDEQKWVIIPVDATNCRIQTAQKNCEFMTVEQGGNVRRWASTGGKDQLFSFVNSEDDWWNIQERTRNEYLAVGWTGHIVRWAKTGGKEQKFKLVPVNPVDRPTLRRGECEPGDIGDIPRITGYGGGLPESTRPRLVAETVVPATFVSDPHYSDKVEQVVRNPYYVLSREQYWGRNGSRGHYYEHDGHRKITREVTVRFGVSESTSQTIENTLGFKVSVSGEFKYQSVTAAIQSELTHELKVRTSQETTITTEREEKSTVEIPAERFVYALWSMIDSYTLINEKGDKVQSWEVVLDGTSVADGYPNKLATVVKR